MNNLIFRLFLIARYIFTAGDVKHIVDYCWDEIDKFSFWSMVLIIIISELLLLNPKSLPSISLKVKNRIHLIIHILLAINSLFWMIKDEDTSVYGIIFFIIVLIIVFYIGHKLMHAIYDDKQSTDKGD